MSRNAPALWRFGAGRAAASARAGRSKNRFLTRLSGRAQVLERWDTLVRAWGDMDANKDGVITFAEFQTGLKNSGLTVELDQAQRIWKAMDTSEDNEVLLRFKLSLAGAFCFFALRG